MTTQPMDHYFNRERLTDLAQFAVPNSHDLWPRIEQAARASASGITTPRPGILSLGLSRAWTAVGVLLIAATFAALGFGLAVLVLSNGHDQVPAAQPTATATPTPAMATSTPIPPTPQAHANTPPLYEPDYPRDLDHIRETLGSVFVPTYVPDGYQLTGASVNTDPLLPFEASLVYRNGRRGIGGEAVGEFFIYQFPENWDADTHETNFEEQTIDGLTIRRPWHVRDRAAFYFQVDGRWLFISVFGESPENVDTIELVGIAKSVVRVSDGVSVEWQGVSGITRRGFGSIPLSELYDLYNFIERRKDSIYISTYLPDSLGLESIWISQESDSLTLEFVLPSHLRDGKRLERVTLSTRSNPTLYPEQVDVGGLTGYVFWGTSSSDVSLVFQHDGHWFELEGSPAADRSVLEELIKMALSLGPYGVPQQPSSAQTNTVTPSTIPSREAAHAKMQTILTGETLDRYRALPPAYQEALGFYTWHDLPPGIVRSAVNDKIDQWGDDVIPLPELLGEERAKRFDGLKGQIVNHAHLLVSYYVLILNTQSSDEARTEAMQQYVDYIAPPDTEMPSTSEPDADTSSSARAPMVAWPPLEKVLTKTALARLDLLGPRIRERVIDIHAISSSGESDIKTTVIALALYEMFLLKAQAGLEIPSLEETLIGDDLVAFMNFSEADRDNAESFFQRQLFSLHYVGAAGHPPNSTIPKPTPDILAKEATFAMEWVLPTVNSKALRSRSAEPPPIQPQTTPESWVSENGFIQFTTGNDPLDDTLPGTHPWCFPPTRAPDDPGPWLVPSKLPEGMEQTVRNQLSTHNVLRVFQSSTERISMSQTLCATRRLDPLTYRAVPVGYRTAYVTAAVKPSADGTTPEFDPNVARSLVIDIGYGVVSFNVFGSVTVDELVAMAASLVPEELTDAEAGPYPQVVLDALGTSFGPIYVPGKLPEGYEMFGQLIPQPHGAVKATQLTYMRTRGKDCHFYLRQAAPGQRFPDVAAPAVVIDGLTLKTTHKPPLQPAEQYTTVHFKFEDVWIGVMINRSSTCDHSLKMVAEIAASMKPRQP